MNIIKNYLEEKIHNKLWDSLESGHFPWYYVKHVADPSDIKDFQFHHTLYENGHQKSDLFYLCHPLLGKLNFNELIRVRINMYTRKENPITHKWHTDSEILHKVALYHVNQNNGRTEFKDLGVSESEANSIVLFDGKIQHRSVTQTDAKIRVNININYV